MDRHVCTFVIGIVAILNSCAPSEKVRQTELFVTPNAFIVDGVPYPTAGAAAFAVQQSSPHTLVVACCSVMANQRVLDAMASLEGKHSARVLMSVVGSGARGCPDFNAPSAK